MVSRAHATGVEYAVRTEHGEIIERASLELAELTIRGITSRGGTATLMSRQVLRTEWEEDDSEPVAIRSCHLDRVHDAHYWGDDEAAVYGCIGYPARRADKHV